MEEFEFWTEEKLIAGLLVKDKLALKALYDQYGSMLNGVICCVVNSETVRERMLQDTIISIWYNAYLFDPSEGRFFIWMIKILRTVLRRENDLYLSLHRIEHHFKLDPENPLVQIINANDYPIFFKLFFLGFSLESISKEYSMKPDEIQKSLKKTVDNLVKFYSSPEYRFKIQNLPP